MKLGTPVFVPSRGPGVIWFRRPTGGIVVRLDSGDYVDLRPEQWMVTMPRHECAALKLGDRIRDVYGLVGDVYRVLETGQSPPTLIVIYGDVWSRTALVRCWYEIAEQLS